MNEIATSKQNKKNDIKELLNKTLVRALVTAILEIGLASYTALVSEWNIITYSILAAIIILNLSALVFYTVQTSNSRAAISKLMERNAYLEKKRTCDSLLIGSMFRSCEITIARVSKIIEEALSGTGQPSLKLWNFQLACDTALHKMHNILRALSDGVNGHFELYIARVLSQEGSPVLRAIACSSDEACNPEILNKNRIIEKDGYYDVQYVRDGKKDIVCLMDHTTVSKTLCNRIRFDGIQTNGEKYNQMFLVPILCRKTKLVGVFVISCLGDTCLAESEEEAIELIKNEVEPYLELLMVFYKLEKVFQLKDIK